MNAVIDNVYAIILAAGASSRMGSPKQLLEWRNRPLLEHAVVNARAILDERVIVVLGAHAESIQTAIDLSDVSVIVNPDYHPLTARVSGWLVRRIAVALQSNTYRGNRSFFVGIEKRSAGTASRSAGLKASFWKSKVKCLCIFDCVDQPSHSVLPIEPSVKYANKNGTNTFCSFNKPKLAHVAHLILHGD